MSEARTLPPLIPTQAGIQICLLGACDLGPRYPGPHENRQAPQRITDAFASAIFVGARRGDERTEQAIPPTETGHSVHERVCFKCSSVVGTITQSWCPPLLGQMPTSSSVCASMNTIPLDWRWKPLNTPTTYLPS